MCYKFLFPKKQQGDVIASSMASGEASCEDGTALAAFGKMFRLKASVLFWRKGWMEMERWGSEPPKVRLNPNVYIL